MQRRRIPANAAHSRPGLGRRAFPHPGLSAGLSLLAGPSLGAGLALLVGLALPPAAPAGAQESVPQSLTLDDALAIASRNNPGLQAFRNDMAVEDWNVRAAYASWLPTASASSSLSWQGAGEQRFGSITADQLGFQDQPSFYFSNYSIGLGYSLSGRTLLAPGQAKRNREAARARVGTQEANLRLNVTRTYLEVLRQIEGLSLSERELERAQIDLRLAQGRQEVGSGNALDVQQAEVAVGRSQVSVLQARTNVRTSRIRLLQQLGVDLSAEPELSTEFVVAEPTWTADALYRTATADNPQLNALRANEESSRYGVRMARSAYYPSLSISTGWSGFTRQASSTASQEAQAIAQGQAAIRQCQTLNDLTARLADPLPPQDCSGLATPQAAIQAIRDGNRAFPFNFTSSPPSASLSVSIPVFQGLSRQQNLEAARAGLSDVRFQVREQELALRADVEAQVAVVRTAYETAVIEERNQALADEQLRLARERYRLGFSNFIELAEATTVKARADRERIVAIFTYHDAVADLEAVVGATLRNP